jgi:hypothetical protein
MFLCNAPSGNVVPPSEARICVFTGSAALRKVLAHSPVSSLLPADRLTVVNFALGLPAGWKGANRQGTIFRQLPARIGDFLDTTWT